ncbi:hypothetical protein P5673_029648 [Acropora cervicornis]|uniref:Uncharacterized protein n=1 Tax=Acropora cervicornis TaxID=6130 RepID=A0AAD9UTX6_ACRCE|nr:hypothetical protein P5673_029648 [Acropora cervicornis]
MVNTDAAGVSYGCFGCSEPVLLKRKITVRLAVTTKRKSCDLVIDKVWRNLCSVGQLRHPELNTTVSFLKANAES